jgi:cellulose synthase/poly-beta-1,6-N-acetylglucosamine synthase-like glycosyltransferase
MRLRRHTLHPFFLCGSMRVSLLIPCHNEETLIRLSIASWLSQTRPPDEIIVVDDSSTDGTPAILAEFADRVTVVRTPSNLGNKSYAQEFGLRFVTGEMFITTDADTVLAPDFVERIEKDFVDPETAAVGGYVKSLQYNWLTMHRAFEYAVGQNFHKLAQSYLEFMFVIPGAAGAFRTEIFKRYLLFDHDTITEDLDFTYKLHKLGFKIVYDRHAVVYTQDPISLRGYITQMRRWLGGGWQNLLKHHDIALRPVQALELSLMYVEGFAFSVLTFLVPLLNLRFALLFALPYFLMTFVFSVYAAVRERRKDLLLAAFPHMLLLYINSYLFLEQFVVEVVFKRKHLAWLTPERTV